MSVYSAYSPHQEEISGGLFGSDDQPIVLRDEQKDAIRLAKTHFSRSDSQQRFLWNAKMRFGKTVCALELAKEMGCKRTLIVTHRPVVNDGWSKDFKKIFLDTDHNDYGTKSDNDGFGNYYDLEAFVNADETNHYVFFASMQYLRRSTLVGGDDNEQLKKDIINTDWDLVVVDEAHEGTRTSLGQRVIDLLSKEKTKLLHLSGTPFNLYEDFDRDKEIYTWDYIMEQKAKAEWPEKHPDEPNPYEVLPHMNILTYDLGKLVEGFIESGGGFKFSEFFRTWTGNPKADNMQTMPEGVKKGDFVHEDKVRDFLDLLCKKDDSSNYPFSTDEFRDNFRHTLWVVPGVKEAAALSNLLHNHRIFKHFHILNVAGKGDEDEKRYSALDAVKAAIGEMPFNTRTITISCGRLTTGVTIKPWTAVFYMKGSENTSAATYMQTIFRVQSPDVYDGKMKTECYVFDFAPDRTLKMLAETAKFARKSSRIDIAPGATSKERDIAKMEEFLGFCPVISLQGGRMVEFDANSLFEKLEQVYVDRVVRNGFNDDHLYDEKVLLELSDDDVDRLNDLGGIISKTTNMEKPKRAATLNASHMTPEQRERAKAARAKLRRNGGNAQQLSPEERAALEQEKREREARKKERDNRITILRGISLRIPLLIFGAELTDESEGITIDNFTRKIDDASWLEFMPRGVTKAMFNQFKKCYNPIVFTAAGKNIRKLVREADSMHLDERIQRITEIHAYFHNPDKETVLTPWRVVNMHMSDCLGGYCFFNEKFDGPNFKTITKEDGSTEEVETNEPRFVFRQGITDKVFEVENPKILEINSKTGLYPLYMTYSLYRKRFREYVEAGLINDPENPAITEEQVVWDDVVSNYIYVICNTPMAAKITKRTLLGFREVAAGINIKNEALIERATNDIDSLVSELSSISFWKDRRFKGNMKFNAIVGNPPYQVMDGGAGGSSYPVYNRFVDVGKSLEPEFVSMIMPARWYAGGRGLDGFRDTMIRDKHIVVLHDYQNATDCFKGVEIKGGICYFLWDKENTARCRIFTHKDGKVVSDERYLQEQHSDVFIRYKEGVTVFKKVQAFGEPSFDSLVSAQRPFGLRTFVHGESTEFAGSVRLYERNSIGYINRQEITRAEDCIDKPKVFISAAYNAGDTFPHQILGKPILGRVGDCCTETYIMIGPFKNEDEASSVISYIKTKFFRFLVLLKKTSQHAASNVYQFVPIQDWSRIWTDKDLYRKYQLSSDEIEFIESMIRPMGDKLFDDIELDEEE